MLYPDPTQRMVLGWQIRWVAGLFALLMVAAGAIPAYAADRAAHLEDTRHVALHATADDERVTSGEIRFETGELLGAKPGSETEVEIEEDEVDSSCLPSSVRALPRRASHGRVRFEHDLPTGRPGSGRPAPRAPPLA